MKWVRDQTGRFPERPHYEPDELDQECEAIISGFLRSKHDSVTYPVITDDLVRLLQRETQDLDLYADLTQEGKDVEGVTDFFPSQKPRVRIARELSEQTWRQNRLRTTLTHELGHVKFHNFMRSFTQLALPLSVDQSNSRQTVRCRRDTILGASTVDWMEWQAGYMSGAFLMPVAPLRRVVGELFEREKVYGPALLNSPVGQELIREVQKTFEVSADAARVRLLKLGHITKKTPSRSLFSSEGS